MRILALELGAWSIKGVELESRFGKIELHGIHEVILSTTLLDKTEAYKNAVAELMNKLATPPEKIITSLPNQYISYRFLELPVKQRKKIEKMYRFEVEELIPLRIDDCLMEHAVTKIPIGSRVQVAVAPKKHIRTHLTWLKAIGLDPDWICTDSMGISNIVLNDIELRRKKDPVETPILLLDIGHTKTHIVVIGNSGIELIRSISWGGFQLTQSISQSLGISMEEAESRKCTLLNLSPDHETDDVSQNEVLDSVLGVISTLIADINHTINAYQNQSKIKINFGLLAGGTSQCVGIPLFLSSQFGVRFEIMNPFELTKIKNKDEIEGGQRFAEVLGRALVATRKMPLLFNFRQEEFGKETSIKDITEFFTNPIYLKLGAVAGSIFLLFFIHIKASQFLIEKEMKLGSDELKKLFNDTFKSAPAKLRPTLTSDLGQLKKYIEQKKTEQLQKLKIMSQTNVSMLGLLKEFSVHIPPSFKVDINVIDINQQTFVLDGVLYEGDIKKLEESIKQSTKFGSVAYDFNDKRFKFRGQILGK